MEASGENYRAFLLRCWQEADASPAGQAAWRFTLVQLGQEETKKGFASLEDLITYLQGELDAARPHVCLQNIWDRKVYLVMETPNAAI